MSVRYKLRHTFVKVLNKSLYIISTAPYSTISFDEFCEHMANHNTPYSKGTIKGVLTDMTNCIRELILEGNNVQIDGIASFGVNVNCKAGDADAVTADTPLSQYCSEIQPVLCVRALGTMSSTNLKNDATFVQADTLTSAKVTTTTGD